MGRATRVAEYLVSARKAYTARVRLGESTDTYDADGVTVRRSPVAVDRVQIEETLARFRGRIEQIPPMFSAVKRDGVPLYRLARKGIEVSRSPRTVEVFELRLAGWEPPDVALDVECSAGTYVRSLAYDIGQALGCGAHLTALTRRASGSFRLEDSTTMEEFALAADAGRWRECLLPLDSALTGFPAVQLEPDDALRICHGQAARVPPPAVGELKRAVRLHVADALVRVYDQSGDLLAIARLDQQTSTLHPHKVFCTPESGQCA
jgi:tRNA pseudouridine55 synthase